MCSVQLPHAIAGDPQLLRSIVVETRYAPRALRDRGRSLAGFWMFVSCNPLQYFYNDVSYCILIRWGFN